MYLLFLLVLPEISDHSNKDQWKFTNKTEKKGQKKHPKQTNNNNKIEKYITYNLYHLGVVAVS